MAKAKQVRLPRAERRKQILAAAAEFFAERGFAASTRELAQRLGVTQALLYRYFASKEILIDEVFNTLFVERWEPSWQQLLDDRSQSIASRLCAFYCRYLSRGDALSLRLFIRANLDGLGFAARYRFPLTERVLAPVIAELRHELKLSPLQEVPLLDSERELAMVLHGSLVFSRIREHVYQTVMTHHLTELVELQVMTFLPGALEQVARLHANPAS